VCVVKREREVGGGGWICKVAARWDERQHSASILAHTGDHIDICMVYMIVYVFVLCVRERERK